MITKFQSSDQCETAPGFQLHPFSVNGSVIKIFVLLSLMLKNSINFPFGFVGQKHTVKIIGFVGVMLALLIGFVPDTLVHLHCEKDPGRFSTDSGC